MNMLEIFQQTLEILLLFLELKTLIQNQQFNLIQLFHLIR